MHNIYIDITMGVEAYETDEISKFTDNDVANRLLTSWSMERDEDNDTDVPISDRIIYKLYETDRSVLKEFVIQSKLKDCDFEKYVTNEPYYAGHTQSVREMLANIDKIDMWTLVYLVLEIENTNNFNKEFYPKSILDLVD